MINNKRYLSPVILNGSLMVYLRLSLTLRQNSNNFPLLKALKFIGISQNACEIILLELILSLALKNRVVETPLMIF